MRCKPHFLSTYASTQIALLCMHNVYSGVARVSLNMHKSLWRFCLIRNFLLCFEFLQFLHINIWCFIFHRVSFPSPTLPSPPPPYRSHSLYSTSSFFCCIENVSMIVDSFCHLCLFIGYVPIVQVFNFGPNKQTQKICFDNIQRVYVSRMLLILIS